MKYAEIDDAAQRLLVGDSEPMRQLRATIRRVAPADLPVLIVGPTGVGKELVARAIHAMSRRSGELVALNVCAVAETMFEATLFGHVKGAFTGATADTAGYLAEANGGSLFLDEIGSLTVAAQAKLLRALETGTYRPVGAPRDRQSRFRVIAATNEELNVRAVDGEFRADLYHRLGGVIVRVPTLRERRGDVPALLRHFTSAGPGSTLRLTDDALTLMADHEWPGNVREFRHVAARLALLAGGACIATRELVATAIGDGLQVAHDRAAPDADLDPRTRLVLALRAADWNVGVVAESLGVDRATVYRRMKREGVTPPARRPRVRPWLDDGRAELD